LPFLRISPSMMRTRFAAHGAADAAVVHLEYFFVGADDEVVVDGRSHRIR